jgi:flagellar hook-associated protein 1 FlgK
MIADLNSDLERIGELNGQILAEGTDKGDANILMDERSKLLTSVAETVGINCVEDSNGNVNFYLASGDSLMQGATARRLEMVGNEVRIAGTTEPITASITTGRLGAMIELRDELLPGYLNSLNLLADGIVDAVNEQHSKGYTMEGAIGGNFFAPVADVGTAARHLAVDAGIAADARTVAASATVNGDGENAGLLGALADTVIDWGASSSTINGFYEALTVQVGLDVREVVSRHDHQSIIMNQLEEQRDSYSGVSIDEEMMNLMKYQMGYNAAGRLVTVADELMDTLIALGK